MTKRLRSAGHRRGKINNLEVARQARVAFNAKPDKDLFVEQRRIAKKAKTNESTVTRVYPDALLADAYHHINKGDMCFSMNHGTLYNVNNVESRERQRKKRKTMPVGNKLAEPIVFSSANGLYLNTNAFNLNNIRDAQGNVVKPSPESIRQAARNTVKFVGFSDTDYPIDTTNEALQKTGIAIQRGGVLTTINTGNEDIKQFETVLWDLPDPEDRGIFEGIENETLKFKLVPADPLQTATYNNLVKLETDPLREEEYGRRNQNVNAEGHEFGIIPTTPEELVFALNKLFESVVEAGADYDWKTDSKFKRVFFGLSKCLHEQNERIVGRALESAAPGEEVPIMAGSHF